MKKMKRRQEMGKKLMAAAGLLVLLFLAVPAGTVMAGFSFGISANDQGANNFYMALSDYNKVPRDQVAAIRHRGIPDEELPVVYFLAAKANVRPEVVADMRLKHMAWMDIALNFHLSPDVFYVPVKGSIHSGPYAAYYSHFKAKKSRWKKIRLTDDEVTNAVNLKFASEHYGYAPEDIIKMRNQGKTFVQIHGDLRSQKGRGVVQEDRHNKDNRDNKDRYKQGR